MNINYGQIQKQYKNNIKSKFNYQYSMKNMEESERLQSTNHNPHQNPSTNNNILTENRNIINPPQDSPEKDNQFFTEQTRQIEKENQRVIKNKLSLQQCKQIYKHKSKQIKALKETINHKILQIKKINQDVDLKMAKSIDQMASKISPSNVDIHTIFTAKYTQNTQIAQKQQQLENIRVLITKQKSKLQKINENRNDPFIACNLEQAKKHNQTLQEKQATIKNLEKEKIAISSSIMRITKYITPKYLQESEQNISKTKSQTSQIINKIKQFKKQLYELDKQDTMLSEKTMFYKFLCMEQGHYELSKQEKQQIKGSIDKINQEIGNIMNEKKKAQIDREQELQKLKKQCEDQNKKKQKINQSIREIEAYFLNLNNMKKLNQIKKTFDEQQYTRLLKQTQKKSNSLLKNSYIKHPVQRIDSEQTKLANQSKITQQIPQFPMTTRFQLIGLNDSKQLDSQTIFVSDQHLIQKNIAMKKIIFSYDEEYIYGVNCSYEQQGQEQVKGYKMTSKISKITKTFEFQLLNSSIIQFTVGIKLGYVKYFQLKTNDQSKQFQWGIKQLSESIQTFSVPNYKRICLASMMKSIENSNGPHNLCVAGIGFYIL